MSWGWFVIAIVVILAWAYSPLGQFRPAKPPAYSDRKTSPKCAMAGYPCSRGTVCCSGQCTNGKCPNAASRRQNCFSADSTVVMEDGQARALGELCVGDRVATVDASGRRVVDTVRVITHQDRVPALFLCLRTEDDHALEVTPDHFVYVIRGERVQLIKAQTVSVGDWLVRDEEGAVRVVSVDVVERCGAVNFYMTRTPVLCVNGFWASPLCDSAGVLSDRVSVTAGEFLGRAVCEWRALISV